MPVLYGNYSIRPAPYVALTQSYATLGDGRAIGTTITARLTGTITAEKTGDTYTPLPIEQRLSKILAKQKELRDAFSIDGQLFEIVGYDASPPMKFNAVVDSIDFSEGPWVDKSDYTISLHGDVIAGEDSASPHLESAAESWTFDQGDLPRSWKATHTLSAKGKLVYDAVGGLPKKPWEYARDFVRDHLKLGWDTVDAIWSPKSGQDLAGESALLPSTEEWDRTLSETIDESEGTYSISETWVLNPDPYSEEYTVSVRRVEEPGVTTSASISGTITGLRKNLNDFEEKYEAALDRWNTVKDLILIRCQERVATVGGGILSAHPLSVNVDHDRFGGKITYQYEFSDKTYVNDTFETYTVSDSTSLEDYKTTVRVDGSITGAVYLDDGPSKTIKFTRAELQWEIVRNLIFGRAVVEGGVADLKPYPVSANVVFDKYNGTINYTYEFDNRQPLDVRHEFTVSKRYSRDDGRDVVSVDGTITGLKENNAGSPFTLADPNERYNNAVNFYNGIKNNILGMAATYVDLTCVNPLAFSNSTSFNPFAGTVNYSAEFNSQILPVTPGAISETVSITDDDAIPVIAEIGVPGKPEGPVIQDINTVTSKHRSVSIEIVMTPPKYGCVPSVIQPNFNIAPYVPVGSIVRKSADQTTWSPLSARFTRSVSWLFQ